jgi:CheY-like chemotaxis protein
MTNNSTPRTICLIDDDRIYQFTAKRMIELVNPNQKVLVFSNGKEALEYLEQSLLGALNLPDVILLDINMPVMNGWEFLQAYNNLKPSFSKDILIYMLSSSIDDKDRCQSQSFRYVTDYIEKPLNLTMMTDILNASTSDLSGNGK